jgi:hypothetical protein
MRDLHLPTQQSPPILLKRYRRNAVMALEPGQGRKTAALRDAHQVPLLTGSALLLLYALVAQPMKAICDLRYIRLLVVNVWHIYGCRTFR